MHYLIYKITNLVNGKIYIGAHKTDNLDDDYMGSGKLIVRAIEKYGIENFQKDILFEAESVEEMFDKERELIEMGSHSYNLKLGGEGGFDYINRIGLNLYGKNGQTGHGLENLQPFTITKQRMIENGNWEEYKKLISSSLKRLYSTNKIVNGFKGKNHSDDAKSVIGMKNSVYQQGSGNSQYGMMWITDGVTNRKIKKDSVIPEGCRKGRVNVISEETRRKMGESRKKNTSLA